MPVLTDEDKVIRNDVGKRIAAAIEELSAPDADKVSYDNTESGMTADNAQDAIDELKSDIDSVKLEDLDDVNLTSPQDEDELHYDSATSKWKNIAKKIYEKSASGSIVSFNDGGDNIPLKFLIANITAVQSGSGTPSPTNVRAISGWSGCNLTRCGKNILNPDTLRLGDYDGTSPTIRVSQDWKDRIRVEYGKSYTVSFTPNGTCKSYALLLSDKTSRVLQITSGMVSTTTIYTPTQQYDGYYLTIIFGGELVGGSWSEITLADAKAAHTQIEISASSTTYEPYQGTQITIPFGQTVYGGTLDVLSGLLTITHGGVILNGTEAFTEMVANKVYAYNFGFNMLGSRYDETSKCSHFARSSSGGWEGIQNNEYLVASNSYFGVNPNMTLADYKTFLANQYSNGTPVTMIGTLVTPTVIQLTPAQVKTLLGLNNIFADTGNISLSYFTQNANATNDIAEINTRTALNTDVPKTDLTDIFVTGTKNNTGSTISAGTYFYVNGQLSLCKQAISANADLTLNTNYELVTAGALNKIMSRENPTGTGTLTMTGNGVFSGGLKINNLYGVLSSQTTILSSGNDMNDVKTQGFYYIQTGVTNAPQAWCWCIVIGGSGVMQIVVSTTKIYTRAYTGTPLAWESWKSVNLS